MKNRYFFRASYYIYTFRIKTWKKGPEKVYNSKEFWYIYFYNLSTSGKRFLSLKR